MGIRFACHVCEHKLNIKSDLAGRRGICPACSGRFRIPLQDAEKSTPIEAESDLAEIATANPSATTPPATESKAATESKVATESEVTRSKAAMSRPNAESASGVAETDLAPNSVLPSTTILDDDDDGTWYVRPPSGGQYGPATAELLKQWVVEGRVAATSLLWRDGWPQWREASEALPELVGKIGENHSPTVPPSAAETAPSATVGSESSGPPASATSPANLSGSSELGTNRRKRSNRRVYLIGILTGLVVLLIAGLIYAINR